MTLARMLLGPLLLVAGAGAQTQLTADDWREDLRFLQRTVHADYPFLFEKITAEEWDAKVDALHAAIPELEPHEVVAGFSRVVAAFGYGHTELDWSDAPVQMHRAPLNLYWFSDGIFVEGAHASCEDALGARVLRVEGTPVEEAVAAVRPLVPAENDQYMKAHGLALLLIPEALHAQGLTAERKDTVTLTLEKGGETFERTFETAPLAPRPGAFGLTLPAAHWKTARAPDATPLWLRNLEKNYELEHLPEHETLYVRHSRIRDEPDEPIAAFYERVFDFVEAHGVRRLVLDVRLNGGGNNYLNKPIVTGLLRCDPIDRPGGLFVILGRRTFSACQNLVNELDNYTHAVFVGEPTCENVNFFGDNRRVELPRSGMDAYLSFAWWQDKPPWENADWLAPDVPVELSFDDYRTNRDPVLEAILALPLEGFGADMEPHLRRVLRDCTLDEFLAEAERVARDARHVYFDFEDALNRLGYELINANRAEDAAALLELNTRLYPASANTWDSLGEAVWRAGRPDEAIGFYERAIALDPGGPVGDNARAMLERIEAGR